MDHGVCFILLIKNDDAKRFESEVSQGWLASANKGLVQWKHNMVMT